MSFNFMAAVTICSDFQFSSVQFSHSVVSDSLQPHESQHTRPSYPSPTPEVSQTHVHRVGDAIQPSHPLWSPSPPAFSLSQHQGLFQLASSSPLKLKLLELLKLKYWSFSFSISTSNEYSGLISFRMDWFNLLAVHGTLKCLLQHHS